MLKSIVAAILFISVFAQAEGFGFLAYGPRYDSGSTGTNYLRRNPTRIGGGYFVQPQVQIGGDFSQYSYETETSAIGIKTEHYELMGWMRFSPWAQPSWSPYAMVGLGFQKQIVTTSFRDETQRDEGRLEWIPALGIGVFNRVYKQWSLGFEVRDIYRPVYTPRNSLDLFVSLGLIF